MWQGYGERVYSDDEVHAVVRSWEAVKNAPEGSRYRSLALQVASELSPAKLAELPDDLCAAIDRHYETKNMSFGYTTKDSGKTSEYASGMRRDTQEGKPKFRLLWPKGVPFEEQLITRVADLYARGAVKYGDRNWEKSCNAEDLAHHEEALERHFHKFLEGVEDGEDHAAAVVWNVNAVLLTRRNMRQNDATGGDNGTE